MQKILVLNSGSSSIKFQLIEMPNQKVIAKGLVEKIGLANAEIHYQTKDFQTSTITEIPTHQEGLKKIAAFLWDKSVGVIASSQEITAVGHRVVHGGPTLTNTTVVNEEVKAKIKDLYSLAPLHNPPNLLGIEEAQRIFPEAKQIAVFDTAFHTSIPKRAYTYAIPQEIAKKEQIRVYGFHGISHKYVSEKAMKYLNNPKAKLISIHLGNGCSVTAINAGKSIDHSLGFSPITGLVMGTRAGDIDPLVIFYLMEKRGMSAQQVNNMLTKQSGMLGLTGHSDLREIESLATQGNAACQLALEINAYRVKKYIGAYMAALNGVDALIFTAGIGENSSLLREMICAELDQIGIVLDQEKNLLKSKETREINLAEATTKVLVIPTNEELEIAKQVHELL